tara:strand:+ start:1999 stop:2301 length:303 start_codon:yes stop_codon:yes gene_type:complete
MATRLTKVEKFFIENNKDLSSQAIADDMRAAVTNEDVQKYRDSLGEKDPETPTAGSTMARDPEKGVAIMTQTAAEISDEAQKSDKELREELNKDRIYKIK